MDQQAGGHDEFDPAENIKIGHGLEPIPPHHIPNKGEKPGIPGGFGRCGMEQLRPPGSEDLQTPEKGEKALPIAPDFLLQAHLREHGGFLAAVQLLLDGMAVQQQDRKGLGQGSVASKQLQHLAAAAQKDLHGLGITARLAPGNFLGGEGVVTGKDQTGGLGAGKLQIPLDEIAVVVG